MEPAVLRSGEPRELLALVPHLLGFAPRDSAVAVSLRGPRGRVGLVARVDLRDLADPEHGPQVARSLVAHLARDGARRVVLVVYADTTVPATACLLDAAVAHGRDAFDVGFGGVEVVLVGESTYRCLACDTSCCPPDGRPLSDLQAARSGAEMVLAGSVVAPARESLGDVARAATADRRTVARWRRRHADDLTRAVAHGPDALVRWRVGALGAWRDLHAGSGLPGHVPVLPLVGHVEAGLVDRRVRDAVLVTCLPRTGTLPERALTDDDPAVDAQLRDALKRLVDPLWGEPPGADLPAARRALEVVVAHGRRAAQAPATTLLATFAWWHGDGARASVLLERALADEPGYRLAHLVRSAVDGGLAPGWARRPV